MEVSVAVPTHGRPTKLAQCLRALAAQDLEQSSFEVLVGLDGPDEHAALIAADVWSEERPESLRIIECPRAGANATRNRLIEAARGRYLVVVNDDVIPAPDFLRMHLQQQASGIASFPGGAMIAGYSPWRLFDDDTLFDRLIRETSMVFFYDQMLEPEENHPAPGAQSRTSQTENKDAPRPPLSRRTAEHDWGYRHWWTLNASVPLQAVRDVGGFQSVPLGYGYDDIELAYRLHERFDMPVLFRPAARAVHDHRYQPREVLEREERLGASAWRYAEANPAFAMSLFGRDVRSKEELAYSREFVHREAELAQRLETSFLAMPEISASAVAGPHGAALVNIAYQQHLLLKRWYWRRGLLSAGGDHH